MNLTTVAGVQAYTATTGNDQVLAALITSVSAAVLRYLNQALFQSAYAETYNGTGTPRLILRQGPVTAVNSVAINYVAVPASTNAYMPGYVFDELGISMICGNFPQKPNIAVVSYTAGYPPIAVTDSPIAIPASPYSLTTQNLYWQSDVGVTFFVGGTPLLKVNTSPATGQYFVDAVGKYTFAAADTGKQVVISYQVIGIPADIIQAANDTVGLYFKRRTNLDVRSKTIDAQNINYIVSALSPSAMEILDIHKRTFPLL